MNTVRGYYLQTAWEYAFSGTTHKIVFDVVGNVFKNSISFDNLVNNFDGTVIGPSGRPVDGQITIWINPDDSLSTTNAGAVETLIEEQNAAHLLTGGAISTGSWLFYSIKLDSTNREITLKINDVLVQTIALTADLNLFGDAKNATLFRYLNKLGEDTHRYDGMVDDLRVYDKAISDQDETDIYLWGKQELQYQKKVYVPKQATARGCTVGFKFQSSDYMQVRTLGIKYRNKGMR